MNIFLQLLLSTIFFTASVVISENPGLKLRVTRKGLQKGADIAVEILASKVRGQSIPDQSGSSHVVVGKVDYELKNMHVTSFTSPSSGVSTAAKTGITWSLSGAGVEINGDWKYKYKLGFIKISDHGSFKISASGVSIKLSFILGKSADNRPSISTTGCSSGIGDVDVKFHGGASWLYNLFRKDVAHTIKDKLQDVMCSAAAEAINDNAAKALARMKITTKLGAGMVLDYSLTDKPSFTSAYMESYHKGEVYWAASHSEAPFPPPALPVDPDVTNMLIVWMNDYSLNTLGYVAHNHGLLSYVMTAKDLPPQDRGMLNTTCTSTCISSLIPQLKKILNASVELEMKTSTAPSLKIDPSSLRGIFHGTVGANARLSNGTLQYLFTLNVNVNFSLTAKVKNQIITAEIHQFSTKVSVLKSAIGKMKTGALNFMIQAACASFVVPKLNELGKKGLPIPNLDSVAFINPQIKLEQDALRISTDVEYRPETTLYFEQAYVNHHP